MEIWPELSWLTALVSQRSDGSMRCYSDPSSDKQTGFNRRAFLLKRGLDPDRLVRAELVHGRAVTVVGDQEVGRLIPTTDGLITSAPNVALGITVADCLPVFLADPAHRVVGIAHAGWRGLARNIIAEVVDRMEKSFNSRPPELVSWVGPGIGPCHYAVRPEVSKQFRFVPGAVGTRVDEEYIDLKKVAHFQLCAAGLLEGNITVDESCTACQPERYFSYRRDQPEELETMLAVIAVHS